MRYSAVLRKLTDDRTFSLMVRRAGDENLLADWEGLGLAWHRFPYPSYPTHAAKGDALFVRRDNAQKHADDCRPSRARAIY